MDYQKQGEDFLKKTKTTFKAEFLKHDFYFDGDDKKRDIFQITLKRGERQYKFTFGQNTHNSDGNGNTLPTPYDVLSGMQKYDIGDFENFCSTFGYEIDSRKAETIYKEVVKEYDNLKMLYSDEELELMGEIQ